MWWKWTARGKVVAGRGEKAAQLRGSAMAVYKRGDVWWFKFMFRGIVIRESAHTKSRTKAMTSERVRRNELEAGLSPFKAKEILLFSTAAKGYLTGKEAHWQPKTYQAESYSVGNLVPYFGRKLLTDISADSIARYQAKRLKDGVSPRTVNMEIGSLRAILRKHRLWADLQPDVTMLKERTSAGRALSKDEESKLLAAARDSRSRSLYVAILVSLRTGLRNKELRMLRWSMVDLMDGFVTVGVSKTSGGEGRQVALSPMALATLTEWRRNFPGARPEHFVFPTEHVGLDGEAGYLTGAGTSAGVDPTTPMGSWKTAFAGAVRKSGVQCRWHDLRHTWASDMAENGVPEQTMLSMAGWMSRKMLERYSHTRQAAKKIAVAGLDHRGVGTNLGTAESGNEEERPATLLE